VLLQLLSIILFYTSVQASCTVVCSVRLCTAWCKHVCHDGCISKHWTSFLNARLEANVSWGLCTNNAVYLKDICTCHLWEECFNCYVHIGSTMSLLHFPPRVVITAINSNALESPNETVVVRTEEVGPPQIPTISAPEVVVTDTSIVVHWPDPGKNWTMLQFKYYKVAELRILEFHNYYTKYNYVWRTYFCAQLWLWMCWLHSWCKVQTYTECHAQTTECWPYW